MGVRVRQHGANHGWHLTTYAVLEEAGFCVTVPALHSMVNNDKLLAGLQDFGPGVRPLPTLRLSTRVYCFDGAAALRGPARAIGLPYVCVDFLEAGGGFWFSEIEVDGGTSVGGADLTAARFGAYRRHFDRFRSASGPARRWTYAPRP